MTTDQPMCPRCLRRQMPEFGALSRADNKTHICSECGTEEAMLQFATAGKPVLGPKHWPLDIYGRPIRGR